LNTSGGVMRGDYRMEKVESNFLSRGTTCAGTLFLPDTGKPPVVVMAHGFGAERTFRLPAYAERFVDRGLAVFLFDYRNFGDSDGEPRNLVSPRRHVADWGAAISHVRTLREIDSRRIGLWGTSFSGGHALVAAARYAPVSAAVSQVPFVDGVAVAMNFTIGFVLEATLHALKDFLRALTFRAPHYVPIVADPGTFGLMNTPDSKPGYTALVPEGTRWENKAPARIGLTLLVYRPIRYAKHIDNPVLILGAEKDSLVPQASVARAAGRRKNCRLVSLPVGHFDVYVGDEFERVVELEGDFLVEHLGVSD